MSDQAPHFVLYSESRVERRNRAESGVNSLGQIRGGAASGPAPASCWRFVLRSPDGNTHLDVADVEEGASEERLELLAVVRGLEALDQPSKVTLVTASGTIRRGFRFGLQAWRENRWHWECFGKMTPVNNADLWQRIDRAARFHDIECRLLRADRPVDDLTPRAPKFLTTRLPERRGETRREWARPQSSRGVAARLWPVWRPHWGTFVHRLFGWCGLCRGGDRVVIAAH